jgi:PKHD-type hydroxylase
MIMYDGEAWPFELSHTSKYSYNENFLKPEECKKIIADYKNSEKQKATIFDTEKSNIELKSIRECYTSWIGIENKSNWLYNKLVGQVINHNQRYFKFDLFGLVEKLQFTYYKAPGNHYQAHVDSSFNGKIRKLSAIVLLSNPKKFKGGELCLYTGYDTKSKKDYEVVKLKQGMIVIFPSFTLHKVKPVTSGERYSLVSWFTGPNFK